MMIHFLPYIFLFVTPRTQAETPLSVTDDPRFHELELHTGDHATTRPAAQIITC